VPQVATPQSDTGVRGSWSFGNLGATWPASTGGESEFEEGSVNPAGLHCRWPWGGGIGVRADRGGAGDLRKSAYAGVVESPGGTG
jgi:hypothetical protein